MLRRVQPLAQSVERFQFGAAPEAKFSVPYVIADQIEPRFASATSSPRNRRGTHPAVEGFQEAILCDGFGSVAIA
jgi:hypothetical protein